MDYFKLPKQTKVNRVVPKNAFDNYTNTKQKRGFVEKILRITWTHKLSADTINLAGADIQELQLFKVELKKLETIAPLLEIIDKAIPYPIIFWVQYGQQVYFSTAVKHLHPTKDNTAVIDWTFTTDWLDVAKATPYSLNLAKSLDAIHKDFCLQISDNLALKSQSLAAIVEHQQAIHTLEKELKRLKSAIKSSTHFKEKVALNMRVGEKEVELAQVRKLGLEIE